MTQQHEYEQGDLVELARFGMAPEKDSDRVYGTVIEVFPPADHFVPRYRVRVQYNHTKRRDYDPFSHQTDERLITVMEYDIAGKIKDDSQA
tara:strand:- start:861 stop:1133 length:273 start_codon:yes stop_codon:yes gene_type:complete